MARKDDILKSFLKHEILETRYKIKKEDLPSTVREALSSDIPVIKAMSIIVEALDGTSTVTDQALRNQVLQYLNEAL